MDIDLINIFFEEIRVSFWSRYLRENRKGNIIESVLYYKSFPFSKISSFFYFLFRYSKLHIFIIKVAKGLSDTRYSIVVVPLYSRGFQ